MNHEHVIKGKEKVFSKKYITTTVNSIVELNMQRLQQAHLRHENSTVKWQVKEGQKFLIS
jgi:hypothetical protein